MREHGEIVCLTEVAPDIFIDPVFELGFSVE